MYWASFGGDSSALTIFFYICMAQETCKLVAALCLESEKGQLSIVGRLLACDLKQVQAGLGYEPVIELEADLAALSSFFGYPSLTSYDR